MNETLIEVLACPDCGASLECRAQNGDAARDVIENGTLVCAVCQRTYPILRGVPRFVPSHNYADNFGLQWTLFREVQLDSYNGSTLSRTRLFSETTLDPDRLDGKWVLEAGCGAGRFLEALAGTQCRAVGLDLSGAVDAAHRTVSGARNIDIVQANILSLPFRDGAFDLCYSIGVLQHTPDPRACLRVLPRVIKPGGEIAITVYERKPWTKLHAKYLVRPLTRRLEQKRLLAAIIEGMPFIYPVSRRLFALPRAGRLFHFLVPVADCSSLPGLAAQDRYRFTVLDTFDMLSPAFDSPLTEREVTETLSQAGITGLRRKTRAGLNMVGQQPV